MKRRSFLKVLGGGLLSIPLAKLMKGKSLLKPAAKTVAKTLPKVSGMPEWFSPLVNKIMKEGTDITPKASRLEDYETIKKLEIPSETGKPEIIKLTENKATGNITIESSSGGVADSPFEISYTPPKTDINVQTGEPVKYPGDFYVIENRPKPDYNNPGKVEFDYDTFDIDILPFQLSKLSIPRSNQFNYPSPTNIDAQFSAINMSYQASPGALLAIKLHAVSSVANDEGSYDEYDAAGLTI